MPPSSRGALEAANEKTPSRFSKMRIKQKKSHPKGVFHKAGFTYHKKQICRGDQWSPAGVQ